MNKRKFILIAIIISVIFFTTTSMMIQGYSSFTIITGLPFAYYEKPTSFAQDRYDDGIQKLESIQNMTGKEFAMPKRPQARFKAHYFILDFIIHYAIIVTLMIIASIIIKGVKKIRASINK